MPRSTADMESNGYTLFPDLASSTTTVTRPYVRCEFEAYKDRPVSKEAVIRAWAHLLRAYTSHDDVVVSVDGQPTVVLAAANATIKPIQAVVDCSGILSGVCFDNCAVPTAEPSIVLHHSLKSGKGHVISSSPLPESQVRQVALQLSAILPLHTGKAEEQTIWADSTQLELSILNPSPQPATSNVLLHEMLDHHKRSSRPAVVHLDSQHQLTTTSHQLLHEQSSKLASALLRDPRLKMRDSTHAPVIPVLMPQGPSLYVALLAVLKAGAAFCPLNLDAPAERIKFVTKDTAANILLTMNSHKQRIPSELDRLVFCSDEFDQSKSDLSTAPYSSLPDTSLCYIMYTSGSTGQPKGVALSHAAVVQALHAHDSHIPSFRRFLQFAAPTFDVSMFEIFFTLFRGSAIASCDRQKLLADLPSAMNALEVDGAELTPTVAGSLLQNRQRVPGLKVLLTIGEMLSTNVVNEFGDLDARPGILYAMYGPTEAAIHCTLQPRISASSKVGNIGRPLCTVSTFILSLSPDCDVLPVGQIGELALGGYQLADGYLNRPDQTQAAFISHPELGRLYRTGDKARQLPDGSLECLGRIASGQVKLRGQRIELGEIESFAMRTKDVTNSMASILDEQLVLFCLGSSKSVTEKQVLETCKQWLPAFMVPNDIVLVTQWPQLSSGKVDRKSLETSYKASESLQHDDAPTSSLEKQVSSAVEGVLGKSLAMQALLSRAGLDSLQSIRLASALRESGLNINAVDILSANSIRAISRLQLEGKTNIHNTWFNTTSEATRQQFLRENNQSSIQSEVEDVFPCTPLQSSMLVETSQDSVAYWNSMEVDIDDITLEGVERLFQELAQHNPILRTGFSSTEDREVPYVQIIWKRLREGQVALDNNEQATRDILSPLRVTVTPHKPATHLKIELHHAQYDGWSWDLLLADLSCLLRGERLSKRPDFKKFSEYTHSFLRSPECDQSRAFWETNLSGYEIVEFPNLSGKQNPSPGSKVLSHFSKIPLSHSIQAAQKLDVHPQSLFHGALSMLLKEYLGCANLILGTVVSGRTAPIAGIEQMVGPCIATVPLRIDLAHDPTASDFLTRLHANARDLLSHSLLPLSEIRKAAGCEPGRSLFDVLVVWQQSLQSMNEHLDDTIRETSSRDFLETKILIELESGETELQIRATFECGFIPEEQMRLMLIQLDDLAGQLVDQIISDGNRRIGDITAREALATFNTSPTSFEAAGSLASHVEYWAERDPERLAVMIANEIDESHFESQDKSFADLNCSANKIAHALVANDVKPDDLVVVAAEKSFELYVAILGVVKAGAAFIGVAPDTPKERVAIILEQVNSRVSLASASMNDIVESGKHVETLQIEQILKQSNRSDNLGLPFNAENLAFGIFTSGTTGIPKGVLITQQNLSSNIEALTRRYPKPSDNARMLQACSQTFDMFVFEVFWSWRHGMCICTASKDLMYRNLERTIQAFKATHLDMTPTVATLVKPENVPTIEILQTAGEPMNLTVWRNWAGRGLYEGYGPSETTIINTLVPTSSEFMPNYLGQAFENSSVFVIDPEKSDFRLVPRGAVGEFAFGGEQTFRGYLNQDDLNREKILSHREYGRIYRSGDLGRMLHDGSLLISGRADDQVKIRGNRVELGEINSNVLRISTVDSCASFVFDNEASAQQELVAFWVNRDRVSQAFQILDLDESNLSITSEIFGRLQERLPSYMVPDILIPVTSLPQTSQSKIDKHLLRDQYRGLAPDYRARISSGPDVSLEEDSASWSPLESKIAEVLATSCGLPVEDIKRNTSFFSYGIDSISAIALARSLRGISSGVDVDVSTIMRNMTISRLAAAMNVYPRPEESTKSTELNVEDFFSADVLSQLQRDYFDAKIQPCTPLQEAMLLGDSTGAPSGYYNQTLFKIKGSPDKMRHCWESMVERHDILRTIFVSTPDKERPFAQVILRSAPLAWTVQEVSTIEYEQLINDSSEGAMSALASRSPPFGIKIFNSKGSSATIMLLSMHHALYDGVALTELYNEVEQSFKQQTLPQPVSFELFLAQSLSLDLGESDKFWQRTFDGFNPTSFPDLTGKSPATRSTLSGSSLNSFTFDTPLKSVEAACRKNQTNMLAVCQAAWAKVLVHVLGETDVCFGNVVSGRTLPIDGIDRLVAPCFNTLPVRAVLSSSATNGHLLSSLQNLNADCLPFQMTPLRRLQANLGDGSGKRLFDTLFILQQHARRLDTSIWEVIEDRGEMDFPIVCEFCPNTDDDTLNISLHCKRSVLSSEDTPSLFCIMEAALNSCLCSSDAPALELLGLDEKHLAISNPNPQTLKTEDALLHSGFEKNVRERPDAPAIDFLDDCEKHTVFTFAELNANAEKIACAIRRQSVEADEAVPIHLPKGPTYYAAVLGVLKAGAAFTPFDPSVPSDRKKFMMAELGARFFLSDTDIDNTWANAHVLIISELPQPDDTASKATPTGSSSLAYRLYTSGSTGRPKAVSIEHRNAVQTIAASRNLIRWSSNSRLLQFASITFDMCYYDCFMAWSYGFCLCAAQQKMMFNDLPGVIKELHVNMLDLTPSVASSLNRDSVPTVDFLYCIGEAMPQSLVETWAGACVNSYGPTEAAMCVTIFPVDKSIKSAVIGHPFDTTSFHVVGTADNQVVPTFSVGELYLGGSQIARGYHANESLTAAQFVEYRGMRLYKTGDLVRKLASGEYEFVGRADDQVKIRGLRVELGEINSALENSNDAVQDVSTQVLTTTSSEREQLVSFITLKQGTRDDSSAMKKHFSKILSQQLPAYMIPTSMLFLDKIPLSPAGKADRKALNNLFQDFSAGSTADAPTHEAEQLDQTQRTVRDVLATLSSVPPERVTLPTTIFQLGFDSISAVQIASELKKRGLQTNAAKVVGSPTMEGIAATLSLDNNKSTRPVDERPRFDFAAFDRAQRPEMCQKYGISPLHVAHIRPCSSLQTAMLTQFINSEGGEYFNQVTLKVPEGIDENSLQEAWDCVIEKHEMLRTGFSPTNDRSHPMAMITLRSRKAPVPIEVASNSSSASEWHINQAKKVLANLHEPAWAVLLQNTNTAKSMSVSMHHALFDAQTMEIFLSDLSIACQGVALYAATGSIEPMLEKLIQPNPALEERAKHFWVETGKKALINPFPTLHPFHVVDSGFAVSESRSASDFSSLQRACQAQNATMQAAGQAAWASVLAAYTGESIVTFGTVFSGRTDEYAEAASFPCINTIPIVAETAQSGEELLQNLMQHNAAVHEHQQIPLTRIQRWMGLAEIGLFDTLFAYQKKTSSDTSKRWEVLDEQATVEYPISIELEPMEKDNLLYRITYRKDRLSTQQADLILRQLDHALDRVLRGKQHSPESSMVDASLYSVTPAQHDMLPSDSQLLHEFVERGARKHPEALAFEFYSVIDEQGGRKRSWSYRELNEEGNKVAHFLRRRNVEQASIIAVCFDKCPEASFAMLGILKAGCGFLALDPGAPAARKKFIAEDSKATAVITMKQQSDSFAEVSHCPVFVMDAEDFEHMPISSPELDRPIQPSNTSYCLYTSGTTGTPKGCDLSHENAVQALLAFQNLFKWTPKARWLQFASFHFDVSVLEQYWTWSVGVCMVSAPRDLILEDLPGAIRNLGITHIDLTPSLARLVDPEDVPSLCSPTSVFITGGEALKQEIIGKWGQFETIYNGYGPTEATIGCTMFPRVPANGKPSNIGPQFLNVGSFVLKPGTDEPVLRGAQGELCVSGPLVAKGYLNRPDLTAERFPTIEINGFKSRIYRTGDLVRILHDGTFAFLGRADDQVKLRGQRLEIGEINAVEKESSEDIQEVTTLVLKHPKQQREQLVSFLTTDTHLDPKAQPKVILDSSSSAINTAREACQSKLPGYMIPTHFILMNRLPLSANNKIDAKQLKAIYEELDTESLQKLSDSSSSSDKEWTDAEREIADTISQHLGIEASNITKSTSVFELGLDSISAIGLTRALKDNGFGNVHTSVVMKNSTINRLAKALKTEQGQKSTQDDATVKSAKQSIAAFGHRYRTEAAKALQIKPSDIEYVTPCTPLQQGIISRALEGEKPVYFAQFLFELYPGTDLQKLKSAFAEVIRVTPLLRTSFCATNDGHAQVAVKDAHLSWDDIKSPDGDELDLRLDGAHQNWWTRNRQQIQEPLNITTVSSPSKTVMALHIFHALYDGTSLPLIMDLVLAKYHDLAFSAAPAFYEVLPYGPLRSAEGAYDFWMDHLKIAPAEAFSKLEPLLSKPAQEDSISTSEFTDMQALEQCRRSLNTTQQGLIQACWAAVLQSSFGGPVNIGMVVSGRSIDYNGADRTIGPLFNTIPFHLGLHGGQSWKEAVEACHAFNTAALPYQHTALRDIKKWCRKLPQYSSQELFDTLFVFQKADNGGNETDQKPIWKPLAGSFEADYPLAFEAEQSQEGSLHLTIVSQAHISDSQTSTALLDKFKAALGALIADPGAHISKTVAIKTADAVPAEHSNGHTVNGNNTNGSHSHDFSWDEHSLQIRAEVAGLSDLPVEDVDAHTSILELGLDSIDAIKLSSRLKRSAGLQIPVSQIMQSLTVARLAEATSHQESKGDATSEGKVVDLSAEETTLRSYLSNTDVDQTKIERVLPIAPLQEAMMAQMLASDWSEYFNHDILELASGTDIERLKEAWQRVVDANQILRTSLVGIDDPEHGASFVQVVQSQHALQWYELRESISDTESIFEGIRKDMSAAPSNSIPFRLTLLCGQGGAQPTHLIISIAHALYDGWSLGLMHQDVASVYNGGSLTRPPIDPLLTNILSTARDPAAAEYWRDTLSGLTPALISRNDTESSSQAVYRKEYTSKLSISASQQFCKAHGTTLAALCQTAYSLLLATLTHKLDVAFGTVLSGRDSEDAGEVMFPTMNTVAFRTVAHGTRAEMVQYVQGAMSAMKPFERFPLRKAMAMAGGSGAGGLFDTLFIFQRRPDVSAAVDQKELYKSVSGASDIEYPLAVEVEHAGQGLQWRNGCKSDVFSEDQATQLLRDVDDILGRIVQDPQAATLTFEDGDRVSICGTTPFHEAQASLAGTDSNQEDVVEDELPLEKPIRQVLAQVAQVSEDELSPTTTLFNLGLDSISAIKVSSLLRKQGIRLTVSAMLKAGTTVKMAQAAAANGAATETTPAETVDTKAVIARSLKDIDVAALLSEHDINASDVATVLPATAGQTYMLSMHANHDLFYPTFTYDVHGATTPARLRRAWAALVAETAVLRALFVATGRRDVPFIQAIMHAQSAPTDDEEDDDDDDENWDGEIAPVTPFVRLVLRDQRPFGFSLALHIHHALYDGVSLTLLMDRLGALCTTPANDPEPDDSTLPFEDFIASTHTERAQAEQRAFWPTYMAGMPPAPSATKPDGFNNRIEVYQPCLTSAAPLQRLAAAQNVPLQSLILAVYARLYARASAHPRGTDLPLGTYLAHRAPETARLRGPTLALVPLRVPDPGRDVDVLALAREIADALQAVQGAGRAAAQAADIPGAGATRTWVNFLAMPASSGDSDDARAARTGSEGARDDAGTGASSDGGTGVGVGVGVGIALQSRLNRSRTGYARVEPALSGTQTERARGDRVRDLCAASAVRDLYGAPLDVEVAVREGSLDVGVFCGEGVLGLDLEGVRGIVTGLKGDLEGLVEGR